MNQNLLLLGATLIVLPTLALAHENDPKGKEMDPAYKGPGWREAEGGVAGGGFNSSGMMMRSWLTISELHNGSNACSDCWGYVAPSGREYAIIGTSSGTTFVEITNPGNPDVVQYIDGPNSTWRDIKVFGEYAYAVSEGGGGIQVMDMSGIDNGSVSLVNSVTSGGNHQTHNVALDTESGFIYRLGGGSNYGLRIYDLNQDPIDPPLVGEMYDFYVHDAQVVTYTEGPYAGLQVAFCSAGLNSGSTETALYIVDVTDKQNPALMRRADYPNSAYSHQGWLTADRKYFLNQDELNQEVTHVFNVENPYQPFHVGDFDNGNTAITHNIYTTETFAFTANYTSGIRVFDVRDAENMREVGFFDTYPNNDDSSFNGLWSCYPYFPSGTVIGSDIQRGLFVWTPDLAELILTPVEELPRTVPSAGAVIDFQVAALDTTVDPASAFLTFDDGSGQQQVAASQVEGNVFRAVLPEVACPATLNINFSAQDVEGELFTSETYSTLVADDFPAVLDDDFEENTGWTVEGDATTASEGVWMRGWPIEAVGAPSEDYDGSGRCYLTGNGTPLLDVDERTVLVSPRLDASGGDAFLSYARWFSNAEGPWPAQDVFVVEISDDDGSSWTELETVGPDNVTGGWNLVTFRIDEYVEPTDQVRVRFIADETTGTDSHVEAAVDRVAVEVIVCGGSLPQDLNGDGIVDGPDLAALLGSWGACVGCPADFDGDDIVGGSDLAALLGAWGSTSP